MKTRKKGTKKNKRTRKMRGGTLKFSSVEDLIDLIPFTITNHDLIGDEYLDIWSNPLSDRSEFENMHWISFGDNNYMYSNHNGGKWKFNGFNQDREEFDFRDDPELQTLPYHYTIGISWDDLKDGNYKLKPADASEFWEYEDPRNLAKGGRRKKKTRKYKGNKYPYKNITKKEAIADFIKLKTTTNPRSLNGLEIVNYGTEKLRVRTKYRGKSLIQRWKDKKARKTLKKFANRLYKGSYTDDLLHAYRSAIALSWGTLSSMRTSAALQMYRKYNAKKVLDFTAGWGSRMTAALAADIDYIGIDTNKSLKKGYNKILKATKKHTKSKVKLFFQPAETVDYSKLDYDFVFTSPPYEYLELYEHMKNYEGTKKIKQAYSANDTKRKNDGFYDTFLIPTIKDIYKHLPKGKWICLNVPDLMYDKIKKKWKACDKKEDYMISKRVGSVMKAADRRGQEFVYCWKKK